MKTRDLERLLLARAESYQLTTLIQVRGRLYQVHMNGKEYRVVLLARSFDFYRARYHIARTQPGLIICYTHDSVLPLPVLSLKDTSWHEAYAYPLGMPTEMEEIERLRSKKNRVASQVLLGLYISGVQRAKDLLFREDFPESTRRRYLARVAALNKRKRGRPVTTEVQRKAST